jgi:hypothetical protein
MIALKCETIIPSRAKNGEPTLCGEPAVLYRMAGSKSSVFALLCARHVRFLTQCGYRIEHPSLSATPQQTIAPRSVAARAQGQEGDGADQLALFGS